MKTLTTEQKIAKLQKKAQKFQNKIENDIYKICEELDYHNSSRFSHNVDRLRIFVAELNDFKIL